MRPAKDDIGTRDSQRPLRARPPWRAAHGVDLSSALSVADLRGRQFRRAARQGSLEHRHVQHVDLPLLQESARTFERAWRELHDDIVDQWKDAEALFAEYGGGGCR